MDQLPLFVEASALALTVSKDASATYRLTVASHVDGEPWSDSRRSRYEQLAGSELVDVICAEVWTRLGLS
jgi:hypothetical protein